MRPGSPAMRHVRLDETSSVPPVWQSDPAFTIVRLESSADLPAPIKKVSALPALLVSIAVKPLAAERYRVWVADRLVPTPGVSAFRANVIDFGAEPSCWA